MVRNQHQGIVCFIIPEWIHLETGHKHRAWLVVEGGAECKRLKEVITLINVATMNQARKGIRLRELES